MNLAVKNDVNEKSENPRLHTLLITALCLKPDVRVSIIPIRRDAISLQKVYSRMLRSSHSQYLQGPKMLGPWVYALMVTAEESEERSRGDRTLCWQ